MSINDKLLDLPWPVFKGIAQAKDMSVQYVEMSNEYLIKAYDGLFVVGCGLPISDPPSDEQLDFEDNFKPGANQPLVLLTQT